MHAVSPRPAASAESESWVMRRVPSLALLCLALACGAPGAASADRLLVELSASAPPAGGATVAAYLRSPAPPVPLLGRWIAVELAPGVTPADGGAGARPVAVPLGRRVVAGRPPATRRGADARRIPSSPTSGPCATRASSAVSRTPTSTRPRPGRRPARCSPSSWRSSTPAWTSRIRTWRASSRRAAGTSPPATRPCSTMRRTTCTAPTSPVSWRRPPATASASRGWHRTRASCR